LKIAKRIQQTENVQADRQIRFASVKEIEKMKTILKSYIFEAIEVEKVDYKKNTELVFY
jgi:uncharacterized protein YdeI (YjbR/CyaY-like superfamily)